MWICAYCETRNNDSKSACVCCGKEKKTPGAESRYYGNAGENSYKHGLKFEKKEEKTSEYAIAFKKGVSKSTSETTSTGAAYASDKSSIRFNASSGNSSGKAEKSYTERSPEVKEHIERKTSDGVHSNGKYARKKRPVRKKALLACFLVVFFLIVIYVINESNYDEAKQSADVKTEELTASTSSIPYLSYSDFNSSEEYLEELDRIIDTLEGIEEIYEFNEDSITVLTKSGKVLSIDEGYKRAEEWSDIKSLCAGSYVDGDILIGVRNDGTVLCIGPDSADYLMQEITGWENVVSVDSTEFIDKNGDRQRGFYAHCSDGCLKCSSDFYEALNIASGTEIKDLSVITYISFDWAAVTGEGKVITNVEKLVHDTSCWHDIERVWLVNTYNEEYIIGRMEDGSTVLAADEYYCSNEFLQDSESVSIFNNHKAEIESWKGICEIDYNFEDDYIIALTDSGKAELRFMPALEFPSHSYEGNEDYYNERTSDVSNVENAVLMQDVGYVITENTGHYIETLYAFICKDGLICDSICGETIVSFVPEDSEAKIKSIVSIYEGERIYGLTEKGQMTRIYINEKNSTTDSTPSVADFEAGGNVNSVQSGGYSAAKVGDYITFGSYEQDNDARNGKEDIEWLVLAKEDDRLLVISRYGLDCQPYNTKETRVTWEKCSLRNWLNSTFLNEAFSTEEQAMIEITEVSADKNPDYNTNPGNATTDKAFLLSINEVDKYFSSDDARMCVPTDYAISQGVWSADGTATCFWWLRSPGKRRNFAADVYPDGYIDSYGLYIDFDNDCVRPALWINPES